jgi:hypothetical protein
LSVYQQNLLQGTSTMPNYCENLLTITDYDETGAIQALMGFIKGKTRHGTESLFTFNNIIPYPSDLQQMDEDRKSLPVEEYVRKYNTDKDGYNSRGYDWCNDNWGTKWEIRPDNISVEEDDDREAIISFATAWSPPEPIIKKLAELYPTLRFVLEYWEGSMCFQGHLVCEEGKVVVEETFDYYGTKGG